MPSGGAGAHYLGGLSWAPEAGWGSLTLDDEKIEVVSTRGTGRFEKNQLIVKVQVKAIECVEITSEEVAKSRVGNVLIFGLLGLGAKGAETQGTLLVHMKSGQTGYFMIAGYSTHEMLAKLTPWLHSVKIRVGPPPPPAEAPAGGPAVASVADEIAKLGELKTAGLLTDEEFAAQKAKLLAQ